MIWRHFWCFHLEYRRRTALSSQVHSWWHSSRRRGLRQPHGRVLYRRVSQEIQERHHQEPESVETPAHSLRASQARPLNSYWGQHRDRLAAWRSRFLLENISRSIRRALRWLVQVDLETSWQGAEGRQAGQESNRRSCACRRLHAYSQDPKASRGVFQWQRAQQEHQSRWSGRLRRSYSGKSHSDFEIQLSILQWFLIKSDHYF